MAVDPSHSSLERATQALRAEDPEGWSEVSQSVRERVRSLVTPATLVLSVGADGQVGRGPRASTIAVSERVLKPRLRDAVETAERTVDRIEITLDEGRCTAVRLDLVGVYGTDLRAQGDEARTAVADVLRTILGPDPAFDVERDITVRVVDVVEREQA